MPLESLIRIGSNFPGLNSHGISHHECRVESDAELTDHCLCIVLVLNMFIH